MMDESNDTPRVHDEICLLEGRIYSLEKEMSLCLNLLTIGVVIAVYFGYKWYVDNVLTTIPGVQP